ncbi:hypothetical protein BABINDRAFT_160804 [Babjeviella inositovora NRRL Y-12698]|uniref:PCI domain-containing protein n=1 Tax=Babjeviella inositovora NRRL Y-12698 TaxID=984486 RepID=A0A1E3QS54_9ASCO|nr:uncharacterized protein BABINDRAFT_160804 [Babjeviella inositovora NRRL Y-12698]ODQ80533.1 hypothetical protein BABINDRAFT_160804 [Babjeviella inositovora NRRL Y-12698]
MTSPLSAYIVEFALALKTRNAANVMLYLSISNAPGTVYKAEFPVPSQHDLSGIREETWRELITLHIRLCKAIAVTVDLVQAFTLQIEVLNCMNRIALREDNWLLRPLYQTTTELYSLYRLRAASSPEEDTSKDLEKVADTVNKTFKLCLNDRNLVEVRSKKLGVFVFAGRLLKIYIKLNHFELAKSVEKAILSLVTELPTVDDVPKSHSIPYLYYSGLISSYDGDLTAAETKLTRALSFCTSNSTKQLKHILVYLIPIKFLNKRVTPSLHLYARFPELAALYRGIFQAVQTGDLRSFDAAVEGCEQFLLDKSLYLMVEYLREYCLVKLFKRTLLVTGKHQLPVSALQVTLEYSQTHRSRDKDEEFVYSLDRVECLLANLIYKGKVKGYMSHQNRVVVLSKTNAFPLQVVRAST